MHKQSMVFLLGILTVLFQGACGAQQAQTTASQSATGAVLLQDFSEDANIVFAPVDPNTGASDANTTVTQNSNTTPCTTCNTHGNGNGNGNGNHGSDANSSTSTASNANTVAGNPNDDGACHGTPQMLGQNGVIRACSKRSVPFHLRGDLGDPAAVTIAGPSGYSISGTARRSGESCEYHFMWSVGTAVEGDYTATVSVANGSPFVFHINVQAGSCP